MSLISVDSEKCLGDGACTKVCPLGLLNLFGTQPSPSMPEENVSVCVKCGHCVAVCLTGALTHADCPSSDCDTLESQWRPDWEQIKTLIRARRSVRTFGATPVSKELLRELVDVVRYAPTGHNAQSVSWLVLHDSTMVRELSSHIVAWMRGVMEAQPAMAHALHLPWFVRGWDSGKDLVLRGAPHLVFAYGPRGDGIAQLGSLIAMTTFELAARAKGLGTCWAGYAMMLPAVEERLALPEGHQVFAAMMVGTPRYDFRRIPQRRAAKVEIRG